jgi:uncharacterized phage infection (PIP) family protein YhgE
MNRFTPVLTKITERFRSIALDPLELKQLSIDEKLARLQTFNSNFTDIVQSLDDQHGEFLPKLERHLSEALNLLQKSLDIGDVTAANNEDVQAIVDSLQTMQEQYLSITQNLEYFRSTMLNMPNLGQPALAEKQKSLSESFSKAIGTYNQLDRDLRQTRNVLTRLG